MNRQSSAAPKSSDPLDVSDPALYQTDSWRSRFATLRSQSPLYRCEHSFYGPYWSVCNYELVQQVELNHRIFSSRADLGGIQIQDIDPNLHRPSFFLMDPPEHTVRRRTVAPMTIRSSVDSVSELVRERTVQVLSGLPRGEVFNWVEHVSLDLTTRMLATMFDFPQERRQQIAYWSDVATANIHGPEPLVRSEAERYEQLQLMADAFAPYWHERIGGDGFDLITMLANGEATKNMSREEFIGTLFLLIVGGNDTTRNSMTGGLLALADNPNELAKVRQNHELIPNMVQEIIRYQTPLIHMRRTALDDFELAGQQIAKGDKIVMWYISANRDESVFPDGDHFLVDRENSRRHLAFGAGVHRCIGDRLAALQLEHLWREILLQDIRIEVMGPPQRVYSNFVRGISSLPVKIVAG